MTRRLVLTFGVLTGLFAAGYGVMFTLLDDFRDTYGISDGALGAVVAIGFFASFGAQVFFAPLADRGHARRLVYVGMALNVLGLVTMAFGTRFVVLAAARMIMGMGAGMAIPSIRRIVILADPQHLGSNIGRLLAADVAGFAVGPAVSAVLVGPLGIPGPFLTIAVATVLCIPVILRVGVDESTDVDARPARFAFDLLRSRGYLGALCLGAAGFLMIGTFDALWVLVLDDLNTADWIANLGISLFAVPMIFLGPFGGRLAQRIGPFRLGSIGLLAGATFMFAYGQLPSGLAMFALAMVHSVNDGTTISAAGVAVGMVSPPERQAGAQGLLGGTQTLVGGIAAVAAGQLYQHQGRQWAYAVCGVAMAVLVGAALLLARHDLLPLGGGRPSAGETPTSAPIAPVEALIP